MPDSGSPGVRSATTQSVEAKLSMWTVVGAVAASVLTAGILGGASGILQIPTIINDVSNLRSGRESNLQLINGIAERIRSTELTTEQLQRQINDLTTRYNIQANDIKKQDYDNRTLDISVQKELAAIEGRSKDRNTEVKGDVGAVQAALNVMLERQKVTGEALAALRQNIYDLATRQSRPLSPTSQSFPIPLAPQSFHSPFTIPALPKIKSLPLHQEQASYHAR